MNHYIRHAESLLSRSKNIRDTHQYIRQQILKETIEAFASINSYSQIASSNLKLWHSINYGDHPTIVKVISSDWGEATLQCTKKYGALFTVLNMANPIRPGGGYLDGCVAQEENIFRRSDCHFTINDYFDPKFDQYTQQMSNLISAQDNIVYIDTKNPRVCIRGRENYSKFNLGYEWLSTEDIFPFIELRSSAINCNYQSFDIHEARKRISAQFNTLIQNNIKYVILGAFGCGAFNNPPEIIANLYKEQILQHQSNFSVIVFAIYNAGYGPDNYSIFNRIITQIL